MNKTSLRSLTILLFLAAGCASKGAPPALYDFGPLNMDASSATAASTAAAAPSTSPASLVVADANGPAWLDNERMYYRLLYADAQQSRPYAQNRWASAPLQLLTQRLKSRIAQAGVKVLSASDAAAGVDLLRIEVDDFSQNFDSVAQSSGQVTLRASLLRGHRLVDQKTFSRNARAGSADAPGGARALAAATDAVAGDILAWLGSLPAARE
ncbi:MAG TPA: ABC-type transport auxiliary lipoprotein family protein [Janthinobacterium sp.]|nr:ABC-type transport auxiliary lipoprotein family protein [Janthinobacterium sp.]